VAVKELLLAQAHANGYRGLRHSHGYIFQHLIEGPRTVTALAKLLGVTQQAASKSVAGLVELGYLPSAPLRDRRTREVAFSERGRAAIEFSRKFRWTLGQSRRARLRHGSDVSV
jgi:DNA-binding MarR family transcriptional regulator